MTEHEPESESVSPDDPEYGAGDEEGLPEVDES
jgi:hypothetical protein